jgi:N-acetyl-anhydromuramyl-L-alanine amidase AmpD
MAGSTYWGRRWKYIVIHHSAGSYGNIDFLRQVHRQRQPRDLIDAIPYHYVIGNGNGLGLGEIASDWRQELDLWGTHVSAHNVDRNFRGIGICLIGNFETDRVPAEQYSALLTLTLRLMHKYGIPPDNVSGHGYIPGEATKCPGKNFPYHNFLSDIASDNHAVADLQSS